MKFEDHLKNALLENFPKDRITFVKGWRKRNTGNWRGPKGMPVALVHHHTAGARTDSKDPDHPGNKKGANSGVVNYCIQKNNSVPYCNFVADRDGHLYVLAAGPVWHAGLGDFPKRSRFAKLRVPRNQGNSYMAGVEIVSKGLKRDFTKMQLDCIDRLNVSLLEATGWKGFWRRTPNHKSWAPKRKIDTRYSDHKWRKRAVRALRRKRKYGAI